jgi:capsular polysaccharide biosynthesis protein
VATLSLKPLFHDCLLRGCPVIEETVAITSHFGSENYGHFMLDMVPLIRKLSAIGVPLVSRPLLDWHRSIYRSLGVDPSDVRIVTDRVVMLRDCMVSNRHNAEGTYAASPQTREVFEAVLGNVLARRAGAAAKRIFVARTTNNLKREMRNRQQLADALAGRGFTVVHSETLPFDVQAAIFAGADVIVAEFGAAMVNVVFASPGTKVVEIIPDDQDDPWSAHLCASLGLEHITLFQRVDEADRIACEADGRVLRNVFFAYDADIERICRVVDSIRLWDAAERILAAFATLLAALVRTLPSVLLAGVIALGGVWVLNNADLSRLGLPSFAWNGDR